MHILRLVVVPTLLATLVQPALATLPIQPSLPVRPSLPVQRASGPAPAANPAPPPGEATALSSTAGTPVTFQLTGGGLNVNQPVSADLGSASTSSPSLSGALGEVTVNDQRGALMGSYTATVVSTPFSTGREVPYEIPAANVSYSPPGSIDGSGTAERAVGAGGALDEPRTAMSATGVVGNNTSAWTPTVTVTLPPDAVAGRYQGTITHSVA